MKKRFLYLFILITFFVIKSETAYSDATVQIEPSHQSIELTNECSIDIQIDSVTKLFAFAVDVTYDKNLLDPVSVVEGSFLNENESTNTFFQYSINEDEGRIIIGIVRADNEVPGVNTTDPVTVLTINFSTIDTGTSIINLENIGVLDPDLNPFPFTVKNSTIEVVSPHGINNLTNNKPVLNFIVHPNPFKSNTTIEIFNADKEFTLDILSISGHLIETKKYKNQNKDKHITLNYFLGNSIPNGSYFIVLVSNNSTKTKKIIIN